MKADRKKPKLSNNGAGRYLKVASALFVALGTVALFVFPEVKNIFSPMPNSNISPDLSSPSVSNKYVVANGMNVGDKKEGLFSQEQIEEVDMVLDHEKEQTRQTVRYEFEDLKRAVIMNDYENIRKILKIQPELASFADENGWQAVHEAARALALNSMRVLIEEFGVDINARTGMTELTPLTLALSRESEEGNEKLAEIVSYLQSYINVEFRQDESAMESYSTTYNRRDLVDASTQDNIDLMTEIISRHPEYVHEADENGWQPLHEAVRAGKVYAISHLIEFGHADVNAQTNNGMTPLYMANQMFNQADPITVEYLLKMGAIERGPKRDEDL